MALTFDTVTLVCGWYALCDNDAVGLVSHPVLGLVPVCERCRAKHDMVLERILEDVTA